MPLPPHLSNNGPRWPPADDPVESSLRRAYLRAEPGTAQGDDPFDTLLHHLSEALSRRAPARKTPPVSGPPT